LGRRIIFGVARHVEPMPTPALAVLRRSQQTINQVVVGGRRGVVRESFYFFIGRFQAEQIDIGAPQERRGAGGGRRREPFLVESRQQERVDLCLKPCCILD